MYRESICTALNITKYDFKNWRSIIFVGINPDNTYEIQVDGVTKMSGNLLEDFE